MSLLWPGSPLGMQVGWIWVKQGLASRAHRQGALLANLCFTQIHPTCIPSGDPGQSKLTLMSESLRNAGRIWLPAIVG
ncbi:MAG: hypothetical protein R6U00_13240, partial [Prochlorococcaceae cyanobacterium]